MSGDDNTRQAPPLASRFTPIAGVGVESEVWLLDRCGQPALLNQVFLQRLANPLVVPELGVFNIELNTPPLRCIALRCSGCTPILTVCGKCCQRISAELDAVVMLIGILSTMRLPYLRLYNGTIWR